MTRKKNYKLINFLDMRGSNLTLLAEILGVSYSTIQNKITGKTKFSTRDIVIIRDNFHLSAEEVADLFL